jgi:hypothetical protein
LSRRVRVPGADELFRPTVVPQQVGQQVPQGVSGDVAAGAPLHPAPEPAEAAPVSRAPRTPSGRVRHDEKMTVYVTADELLDLEHARLVLRRAGLSIDRGRLVREAIAIALADLEANGDDSDLVHRLTEA